MSNVYSPSRPLHASNGTQTKMHEEMAEYAYSQVSNASLGCNEYCIVITELARSI
jgi:hypothetical protein